jgi:hypothetical protein
VEPAARQRRRGPVPRRGVTRSARTAGQHDAAGPAPGRQFLLSRLARQAHQSGDPELTALHAELAAYGDGDGDGFDLPDPSEVAMPVQITHEGTELSFLSTITTFGAAYDITLDDIVIEALFPADARTTAALQEIAAGAGWGATPVP